MNIKDPSDLASEEAMDLKNRITAADLISNELAEMSRAENCIKMVLETIKTELAVTQECRFKISKIMSELGGGE